MSAIEKSSAEFDGYTILQLSDLHADLHPDFPARVKEIVRL